LRKEIGCSSSELNQVELIVVLVSCNGLYIESNPIGEMSRLNCWLLFIQLALRQINVTRLQTKRNENKYSKITRHYALHNLHYTTPHTMSTVGITTWNQKLATSYMEHFQQVALYGRQYEAD